MNFSGAANSKPLTNLMGMAANNGPKNFLGVNLSSFWTILVIVLVVFVGMVIYYKTIGYYLEVGWNRIYEMIMGRTSVDIEIGGENGISGALKPMDAPPAPKDRPVGMPGAEETGALDSLKSIVPARKEVFNVSRNIYKYADAPAVCAALGAELATYEQVQDAYNAGADWCNYGWTKGQMALYPTQKSTWDKLQKGSPEYRNACGQVGVNGGYFDNPDLAFGVNCYGTKPPKSAMDELLESQVALPPTPAEIEFDKKVQKFRDQMATMTVLPFSKGQWSE
jgi:hypothetical protein